MSVSTTELLNPGNFPSDESDRGVLIQQTPFNHTWVYVNVATFGKHLRMRAGCQGNQLGIESWNFQSHSLTSVTSDQWFSQSCRCNEASIKTQKDRGSESLQVGEHVEMRGEWCAWRRHGSSCPVSHTLPYASLSSGCSWVMSFIINQQSSK